VKRRATLLAVLLIVEALFGARTAGILPSIFLPIVVRCGILFVVLFAGFSWLRYRAELERLAPLAEGPLNLPMLAANVGLAWLLGTLTIRWERDLAALAVFVSGVLALWPWQFLSALLRTTGRLVWFAAAAALAAAPLLALSPAIWESTTLPASRVTLRLVEGMLRPLLPDLIVDLPHSEIGTAGFSVNVGSGCSGMEGLGLLLAFSIVWFALYRRETHWQRALVLIPVAACTLFVFNAARIAILVLIGNAGAPAIAMRGFHSQAGWIAFNCVAFGMAVLAQRSDRVVLRRTATAAYLVPFLAILAAGMVSGAMSNGFEWAYPLRVLAGIAALAFFWRDYRNPDWRFSWASPAAGALVFALWIARDHGFSPKPPDASMLWIAARLAGACLTVPLAEELAFRGYLMRRFSGEDFEAISLRNVSWLAVAGSSLAFGAMHGPRWMEGTAAGLVYAVLARRSGSLGDAVAGHMTTNLLLAWYVLFFGHWQYW
jgi:exosortase E/protease (VPEID-CTERM system)